MALEKPPTEPAFHQYDKYDEFIIFDVEKMYHTTLRYAGEPQPLDFSLIASQNPYRADKDSLIMNVGSYGGIYDDPIKVGYTLSDGELTMDYNLTKEYDKDKIASLLSSAGVNNIDPEEVEVNKVVDRRVYGLFYGK